jgi:hypothetical protein
MKKKIINENENGKYYSLHGMCSGYIADGIVYGIGDRFRDRFWKCAVVRGGDNG